MSTQDQRLPDIVLLWMLRLLTKSKPHIRIVRRDGINDDGLAEVLGLEEWSFCPVGDDEAREIMQSLQQQRQALERRQPRAPAQLHRNLAGLVDMLSLNPEEQRLLEFVALFQLYPLLETCCEMTRSRDSLDQTTKFIALMLDLPQQAIINALSANSRLTASGLLNVNGFFNNSISITDLELPHSDLARQLVYERIQPLDVLKSIVRSGPKSALNIDRFDHLQSDLDIVVPYLRRALRTHRRGVNILLHGRPGTGKTELCRCLADTVQSQLFELDYDPTEEDRSGRRHRLQYFRAAQTLLPAGQSLLLFDEADDVFGQNELMTIGPRLHTAMTEKSVVNRVLEQNRIPTFWIINNIRQLDPAYVRRFDAVIEMSTLPLSKRREIASNYCGDSVSEQHLARLASLEALTPAVISRAMRVVRQGTLSKNPQLVGDRVEHLVQQTLTAQGHKPKNTSMSANATAFDPDCLHIDTPVANLVTGLQRQPNARLCFYGAPGTGKTAFAQWIAEQVDRPLMVKRASDILSPYVGESEQNLAKAFAQANRDGAALLIDEVDSFLQDRRSASHSWQVTGVNEMLTQMEQFEGLFIASTNLMHSLDQAALRRFDLKLEFRPLKPEQACRLLRQCCATLNLPEPGPDDLSALNSLTNLTPGDFATVMRRSRFLGLDSASALVRQLGEECAVKEAESRPIGFVRG